MTSVGSMIKQIAGLVDTKDVDSRTSQFIDSIIEQTQNGARTSALSEAQLKWIEDLFKRHCG